MLTLSINYDINVRVKRFHGQDQYILCAAFRAMMPGASALFADDTNHSAQAALDIRLSRRPRGNADAHGGVPLPHSWPAPAGPIALNGLDHPACLGLITE